MVDCPVFALYCILGRAFLLLCINGATVGYAKWGCAVRLGGGYILGLALLSGWQGVDGHSLFLYTFVGSHILSCFDLLISYHCYMGVVDGRYMYIYWEDLEGLSAPPSHPHPAPISSHPDPSPVAVCHFRTYLRSYLDQRYVQYVLQGHSQGFQTGVTGSIEIQNSA